MRESDLIQVIIREWENMTSAQRKRFMAGYTFPYLEMLLILLALLQE